MRRVYPRSESAPDGSNLAPHEEGIEFSFPSLIVRLTSIDLVRRVMNGKRSFNYLNTGDIDHSLLSPDLAASRPHSKIFINEVLSPSAYANYSSLNDAAKKNSFKFVWHSAGRVLVGGMRPKGSMPSVQSLISLSLLSSLACNCLFVGLCVQ